MHTLKLTGELKKAASQCREIAKGYKGMPPKKISLLIDLAHLYLEQAREAINEPETGRSTFPEEEADGPAPESFGRSPTHAVRDDECADFPMGLPSRL